MHTFLIKELTANWDYYAFIDGSWAKSRDTIKAGIGGYIKGGNLEQQFIFSGPTVATTPLQAETNALILALQEINNKIPKDKRVIVHTDAYNLFQNIQRYRAGHITNIPYTDTINMGLYSNIFIEHINRQHNRGADYLAKQGATRPNIVRGWT